MKKKELDDILKRITKSAHARGIAEMSLPILLRPEELSDAAMAACLECCLLFVGKSKGFGQARPRDADALLDLLVSPEAHITIRAAADADPEGRALLSSSVSLWTYSGDHLDAQKKVYDRLKSGK